MLWAALLSVAARTGSGQERPSYSIERAGTTITVDGRLDEPAWLAAPDVGPFQFPWWQSGKKEQTLTKVLYDDRHLYLAYVCQDAHIASEHTERDSPVYRDDCVEFFVAPDPKRPTTYFNIEMNVGGAFLDHFRPAGGPVQEQ